MAVKHHTCQLTPCRQTYGLTRHDGFSLAVSLLTLSTDATGKEPAEQAGAERNSSAQPSGNSVNHSTALMNTHQRKFVKDNSDEMESPPKYLLQEVSRTMGQDVLDNPQIFERITKLHDLSDSSQISEPSDKGERKPDKSDTRSIGVPSQEDSNRIKLAAQFFSKNENREMILKSTTLPSKTHRSTAAY
eukprot:IDg6215t1